MKSIDYKEMECIGVVMSNFDHLVDLEVAKELIKGNCYAEYTAWEFWAAVWFEDNKYYAMIKRYYYHVNTIEANNLEELMSKCSEEYGDQ